ncbi:protein CLN8-like [Branchiostoma lanceolatum]|uniref:protein CLN8-like n=1 Tax=Branchiostoma lanceolatum TaxID=7740 RepID=UPI0034535863
MGLLQTIHPSLEELDYTQPTVQAAVIGGTILFFLVFQLLTRLVSSRTEVYRRLDTAGDKVGWVRAILGMFFGTVSTVAGVWTIFWDDSVKTDIAMATTPTGRFALLFSVGFSIFELMQLATMSLTRRVFYPIVFLHHTWLTALLTQVMWCDRLQYLTVAGLAMEIILPCDRISWLLLKAGMRNTRVWEWNQLLLIHTFSLRNMVECYMWFHTYRNWRRIWSVTPLHLLCLVYGGLVLTTFWMTPFWWIESIRRYSVTFKARRQMNLRAKNNVSDEKTQ